MTVSNNGIEFEERLAAVRRKLPEWEVEGVLINGVANRRWLSGFTGSNAQLLITAEKALLATDFRYWEQATTQAPVYALFKHQRRQQDTVDFIKAAGVAHIGVEAEHTTLAGMAQLRKVEGIRWRELAQTVEPMREVKSAAEIEAIRAAAAITDYTMAQVNTLARPGMSERALAWELEKVMRQAGADSAAFTVIVAAGSNSALPHHHPGDRRLQAGDAIIVDLGAESGGYKSDLTRTFYLGDEPDEQFWEIYEVVQRAQTAVLDNLKAGVHNKAMDALARDVITDAGHGEHFGHGLGHGVGLDIHEGPALSFRSKDEETVAAGMVTTVEPGIYVPAWGGVRIEDLVHVTETGAELLSHCPKTPIIPIASL